LQVNLEELVPERGLEPPLPCENCDLNAARLPIPPFGHKYRQVQNEAIFILPAVPPFVNEA
jgi:hypothetical protein